MHWTKDPMQEMPAARAQPDAGALPPTLHAPYERTAADQAHSTVAAVAVEYRLVACYEKALRCVSDSALIARWNTALVEARTRLAALEPTDVPAEDAAQTECLLEAMELARSNGDPAATDSVARECVRLAEARHAALLGTRPAGALAARRHGLLRISLS
ncbi:MAG: hypothetical protein J0H15_11655 [Xanthomonadales bacterium]|nr:hypothetical protein [Xanthomonadales bacterium]